MTDEEFERLRADIEELREEPRRALAEDLGGDPEDYRVGAELASDGGE